MMILSPQQIKARNLVCSLYNICVFGNGTVDETDKRLARLKLKPSYISAKWFHFNQFGLNATKVENAFTMFVAKTSVIAIDVALLPLASTTGTMEIQLLPVLIDTATLILKPIPKLLLQEYIERKFNSNMFDGEEPRFKQKIEQLNKSILQKHHLNLDSLQGYLSILKKFSRIPMLNYIFFHYQLTEEYINYRKHYSSKKNLHFPNFQNATEYFKITFRMLRFSYYIEIHALNYFFSSAYENIVKYYVNSDNIREKFYNTFHKTNKLDLMGDIEKFIHHLNSKVQIAEKCSYISSEIREDTLEQFQYFYSQFFFDANASYHELLTLLNTPRIKKRLEECYDDSLRGEFFISLAKSKMLEGPNDILNQTIIEPIGSKALDGLTYLLSTLTNISSNNPRDRLAGACTVISTTVLLGCVLGGTVAGIKHESKISNFVSKIYDKMIAPIHQKISAVETYINEAFGSETVVIPSSVQRTLGSILFVAAHIPGLSAAVPLLGMITQVASFNPISTFILRKAEEYVKTNLEKKDLDALHRVDRWVRLGYNQDEKLVVKIKNRNNEWIDDFDIDLVQSEFLVFMTQDFARVVRHQTQAIGLLFEQISALDEEINQFQIHYLDILYSGRNERGITYNTPMCRIDPNSNPDMMIARSKERYFDIIIERQNLLISLVNRSYYVSLYNLFMGKIKLKCQKIFDTDLQHAITMFESQGAVEAA